MRSIILIVLILISQAAQAETILQRYWKQFYPGQKCVEIQMFGYFVTKALGSNLYELHSTPERGSKNAIVHLKTKQFKGTGEAIGVKVKWVSHRKLQTTSGFPTDYDVLQECVGKEG